MRGREPAQNAEPRLDRAIIQKALMACLESEEGDVRELLAMLRRFDAQAALIEARETTQRIMAETEAQVIESANELPDDGPALIDLDAFERDLIADPQALEPIVPTEADEEFARRELARERLLQPLYVVNRREDALDESYFASWKLRKAIAA